MRARGARARGSADRAARGADHRPSGAAVAGARRSTELRGLVGAACAGRAAPPIRRRCRADAAADGAAPPIAAPSSARCPATSRRCASRCERIDELMDAASRAGVRPHAHRPPAARFAVVRRRAVAAPARPARRRRAADCAARVEPRGAARDDAEGLRRTSATLQEGIRRVRMIEIGRLFARLDAAGARAGAQRGQARSRSSLAGEETEIDKALVERIAEPLLHLLRNAVAHGIEPPEVRAALGKPRDGHHHAAARATTATRSRSSVADDGAGHRSRRRCAARWSPRGRVDAEAAARARRGVAATRRCSSPASPRASPPTTLAGRGVGLDAVREAHRAPGRHGAACTSTRRRAAPPSPCACRSPPRCRRRCSSRWAARSTRVPAVARRARRCEVTPADVRSTGDGRARWCRRARARAAAGAPGRAARRAGAAGRQPAPRGAGAERRRPDASPSPATR